MEAELLPIQTPTETILVVDDESMVRDLIRDLLLGEGWQILTAGSADEAEELMAANEVHLIISDVLMPRRSGIELLRACRARGQEVPFILMTGFSTMEHAVDACNLGVFSFLHKPIQRKTLLRAVEDGLSRLRRRRREEQDRDLLRDSNNRLRQEVVDALVENQRLFMGMLGTLAAAIDARDSYTHTHSLSVSSLAEKTAQALGLSIEAQAVIREAGLVHDIGKIGVPEAVLLKPGPLDDAEFARMREHPSIGARILGPVLSLGEIVPLVRWHHERFDGQGYPDHLADEAIPLGARILAVCDTWNAMTTDRPYRKALPRDRACGVLQAERGRQFDGSVVEAFLGSCGALA